MNLIHKNKISTWDRDSSEDKQKEKTYDASLEFEERIQPQKEIKKHLKIYWNKNKKNETQQKRDSTPRFKNKQDYLLWVNAKVCVKDKVTGIYIASIKQTSKQHEQQ